MQPDTSAVGRPLARTTRFLLIPTLCLLVAACATAGSSPTGSGGSLPPGGGSTASPSAAPSGSPSGGSTGSISHPTGPNDLVIRYEERGGFVAPQALLTRYPIVSVYGDGRAITEGPVPAIYPGPALPNLQVSTLTEAGLQRLLAIAREDGLLGADASYDATNVADASAARFTVVADGATHTIGAYALGMDDPNLDAGATAARVKLRAFAAALGDLPTSVGADNVGQDTGFAWDSIAVYVADGAPEPGDSILARNPIPWPLSTPLATFGEAATAGTINAGRCGVVSGADAERLRPLLADATQITPWTSGGTSYTLTFHPLLPDQTTCPGAS